MKILRHFVVALGLSAATLASAGGAFADNGSESSQTASERFEGLLRAIDVVPPSREALLASFPDAEARLAAASLDPQRDAWTRQRAISFLSFFPNETSRDVLVRLANDTTASIRALAVYTLGRTYGPVASTLPTPVIEALRKGLDDRDLEVQDKAVRALRWVEDARAEGLLMEASKRDSLKTLATKTRARRAERMKQSKLAR